jgi:flagellar biosynthesis protein FlhG
VRDVHTAAGVGKPTRAKSSAQAFIWAVGGGKGGVGKSVVTSSLAVTLAGRGQRCALVDADLGGANLHTILGVPGPTRTLSHFLNGEVANLADVMSPTNVPNLWLVSGARSMLNIGNLKHSQKQKLLRHVQSLAVDHVFLDLSAGTAYNALDFFLAARRAILAVVPEPTSIENAYHFLKAAFFRSLRRAARRSPVRAAIGRVLEERAKRRIRSPHHLIAEVARIDPEAGRLLAEAARTFSPKLIVNQARTPEHRSLGHEISAACRSHLGADVEYLGALESDRCVDDAIVRREPVVRLHPGCGFALDLEVVVDRLLEGETGGRRARVEPLVPLHRQPRALYDERYFATHGAVESQETPHTAARARQACAPRAAARARIASAVRVGRGAGPPPGITRPGAHLRHHREQLGLDLKELCKRTRIPSLDSLENERFANLPPEPYVRSFVLQYSEALGLSEGVALAQSYVERYRQAVDRRSA